MNCIICNKEIVGKYASIRHYCSKECKIVGKRRINKNYRLTHYEQKQKYMKEVFYKNHPHYCRDYDRLKRPHRNRVYNDLQSSSFDI